MIRIVGLQRSSNARDEFILLQNQGSMRVRLRGHAVVAECSLDADHGPRIYVFSDDEYIGPGMFIALRTGLTTKRWARDDAGYSTYYTCMGCTQPAWSDCEGELFVLAPQHIYAPKSAAVVL